MLAQQGPASLDVVGRAVKTNRCRFEVKCHEARLRPGLPLSRLPYAPWIQQEPVGRGEWHSVLCRGTDRPVRLTVEPSVVCMPEKQDARLRMLLLKLAQLLPGLRFVRNVLLGVVEGAVGHHEAGRRDHSRKLHQVGPTVLLEQGAGPCDRLQGETARALLGDLFQKNQLVIACHTERLKLRHRFDAFIRLRAVSDQVAHAQPCVDSFAFEIVDRRPKGQEIPMDVRKNAVTHDAIIPHVI